MPTQIFYSCAVYEVSLCPHINISANFINTTAGDLIIGMLDLGDPVKKVKRLTFQSFLKHMKCP